MPEDLAKQVREELDKRSITPQDKLQEAMDELARDIAILEADTRDWEGWVMYLIEQLEHQAGKRRKRDEFKALLNSLGRHLQSF
jgi:hypothetical protein